MPLPLPSRVAGACLAACAVALAPLPAWSAGGADDAAVHAATDRLIVKYRDGAAETSVADDEVGRAGLRMAKLRTTAAGAHVMKLDRLADVAELRRIAARIRARDAQVEYVEPDLRQTAQLVPNDTHYAAYQWDLFEATAGISAPAAWDSTNGAGVRVAVIDTGHRPHADLAANLVGGHDMISSAAIANDGDGRDTDALDPGDAVAAGECAAGSAAKNSSWHGTHVAGTIGAVTNNGAGMAGIAYGAKVVPVRVLGKCGGYTSDIADAITWASGGSVSGVPTNAQPARVLNLSLGGAGACGTTLQGAIDGARGRGAVVIVAAGNSGADASGYSPASCRGVVAVAAVDRGGARPSWSNYGAAVALAAPGVSTLSTWNAGTTGPGADNYAYMSGTSMATPHVAGVAALMLSRNPALTGAQVESLLKSTARPFPVACSGCGSGIVDAARAVAGAAGTVVEPPPPPPPPTSASEVEPNNSFSSAQVLAAAADASVGGTIVASSDTDYFRIPVPIGKTVTITLTPAASTNLGLIVYQGGGPSAGYAFGSNVGGVRTVTYRNTSYFSTVVARVRFDGGAVGTAYTLRYVVN